MARETHAIRLRIMGEHGAQKASAGADSTLIFTGKAEALSAGTVRGFVPVRFFLALFLINLLILIASALLAITPSSAAAQSFSWWDESYEYRQRLVVSNSSSSSLLSGYSVCVRLDHTAMMDAGRALEDGNDVRVVYWDGSGYVELDRANETHWGGLGNQAAIWFRTQADVAPASADSSYFLYYGNPEAGSPPADRSNIYLFSDDFSGRATGPLSGPGWTVQSGSWNVEQDVQWDGTTGNVLSHDSGAGGSYKYAYVDADEYGDVVVEAKMRVKPGEASNYFPFGARLDVTTGASYCAFGYATSTKVMEFAGWTIAPVQLGAAGTHATMGNSWHTVQFKLEGCSNLKLTFDGKDIISGAADATSPTLTEGKVYVMGFANQKLHFDDVRVRKYMTPEPTVAACFEEKLGSRPVVTLDRKWLLKADGFTPADTFLSVSASLPDSEQIADPVVEYQILGTELAGQMDRISLGTWQKLIDVTSLLPGNYHVGVTAAESGLSGGSDPVTFHVSYAFYYAWTIDWEGSYVAKSPYLDSLGAMADRHEMPMTQLFNPRIYTLPGMPEWQRSAMTQWVMDRAAAKGDEIGLHLHMYCDFVSGAGLTPLTSPRWSARSDGYDVPFTAYDYQQSLALLDYAVNLFRARGLGTPTSFRGGGCFADEDNLKALSDRGLLDTSGSTLPYFGSLALPWSLNTMSQPYHPCASGQNASGCGEGDYNLDLLEIPDNLGISDGVEERVHDFDLNYSGEPLEGVRVAVLVSHDRSVLGDEAVLLDELFSHMDCLTHSTDQGAVVYATLRDIEAALSYNLPYTPDSLGPQELVDGSSVPLVTPTFTFRVRDGDSLSVLKYRIVISRSPDYDRDSGIVVDYVSSLTPSGSVSFAVGQAEAGGSYVSGQPGQTLAIGLYYWKVMAIRSDGTCSHWRLADGGGTAFRVAQEVGVSETGSGVVSAPTIRFSNPCAPNVVMRVQLPPMASGASPSAAMVHIFDCSGRIVRTLPCGVSDGGGHGGPGQIAGATGGLIEAAISWDGRDSAGRRAASGIYFVQLKRGDQAVVEKLVLIQ